MMSFVLLNIPYQFKILKTVSHKLYLIYSLIRCRKGFEKSLYSLKISESNPGLIYLMQLIGPWYSHTDRDRVHIKGGVLWSKFFSSDFAVPRKMS